jgi:hypothetical protein
MHVCVRLIACMLYVCMLVCFVWRIWESGVPPEPTAMLSAEDLARQLAELREAAAMPLPKVDYESDFLSLQHTTRS